MILFFLFVVFFVGGPLMFRLLTRSSLIGERPYVSFGAMIGCAGVGMLLRYGFTAHWGQNMVLTIGVIALLWLAWIGALAFGVQRVRRLDGSLRMWRWSAVIGAASTTVPWFGLASAHLING